MTRTRSGPETAFFRSGRDELVWREGMVYTLFKLAGWSKKTLTQGI
ncbi:MAG: hypothetical protein HOI33_07925 [Rhodospirillaceae bacterium]|nr:hypothetical protein [Rhodospirillaceae bacterium]